MARCLVTTMSKGLHIAQGIVLPMDTAVQRLAFVGTYNSGKSYAAMKTAEQMTMAGMQWVAMDPMGIWWGMRLAADGKGDGLDIVIFGGQHGDVPIRDVDGALVADTIVSLGISAIIDTSQFETDAERSRFAHRFAERFYWLKKSAPSAVHLFLEEAHEYVPQNVMGGEADMVHVFNRIWKQGGNYGIGGSLITQRPQDINKKASELSALVLAFNVTGSNAMDAMVKWMKGAPGLTELHTLQQGQCLFWSPSWLRIQKVVQIDKRDTYHARYDPMTPGAAQPEVRTLDSAAIEGLRKAFAETVAVHDANDPDALRKRIAELETQLADVGPCENCERLQAEVDHHGEKLAELTHLLESWTGRTFVTVTRRMAEPFTVEDEGPSVAVDSAPGVAVTPPVVATRPARAVNGKASPSLRQALLDSMALLKSMGEPSPMFKHVGAVAGKGANAGPVRRALSELVDAGLVVRGDDDRVSLTSEGAKQAQGKGFKTLAELHSHWLGTKTGLVRDILQVVLAARQKPVTLIELGDKLGKNINAGPVRKALNDALNLGLAEWVDKNRTAVQATDLLFPAALVARRG